jgi:ABC-type sugar transport system ATPase subunit
VVRQLSIPVALRVRNVGKTFATTSVLTDVSFDLAAGEVLALVGQNGSGKSTLVKILAGIHSPDPGASIEVLTGDGNMSPLRAGHDGRLHFIHQDLGLVNQLSTVENLDLGRPLGRRWLIPSNRKAERRRVADLLARFGARIDVTAPVGRLSPAERTIVAIARALDGWTEPHNILILDEPTAAFHHRESSQLLDAVRWVADQGTAVIFISHRLAEVIAVADRVLALRDGRVVADVAAATLDEQRLVGVIVGAAASTSCRAPVRTPVSGSGLDVVELTGGRLNSISLKVGAGEIVGVSGVIGSGREQLNALIFGAIQASSGAVYVDNRSIPLGDPAAAVRSGLAYLPPDRHSQGAVLAMSAAENLTLARPPTRRWRLGAISRSEERRDVERWARTVELRPLRPDLPLRTFSGGNQQKVLLARCLRLCPTVLLLDEPTQGVDIGAKAAIRRLITDAAGSGAAVIVSSSDAAELADLCQRVHVIDQGRIVATLDGDGLSEAALLRSVPTRSAGPDNPRRQEATG